MTRNIAVVVGADGQTASLFEPGIVQLFHKENEKWSLTREFPVSICAAGGMKAVRGSLTETVSLLGDVKTIVGREIAGVPYNILDAAGFNIFEIDGKPEDFLEDVLEMLEENKKSTRPQNKESEVPDSPVKTDIEGKYYINLKDVQRDKPGISSKNVLLPFLRSEKFYELEVICGHIPPWFNSELDKLGLTYDSTAISPSEFKVVIYRRICTEKCT